MAKSREKESRLEEMLDTLRANFKGRLAPPLGGFVYRFTIFLPMLSEGGEVFTRHHRYLLGDLFHDCMRGYTEAAAEGHPPWYGSWARKQVANQDVVLIEHTTAWLVELPTESMPK